MTALRPVLVLIVLVVVLFAISLTLSSRNRDQPVDPATSWFNKFNLSQPVAATNISVSNGTLKNGQWLLPAALGEAIQTRINRETSGTARAIFRACAPVSSA